eukprot:GAFH01000724.1.p1 GENE.GAFH01000724.1~~GAFH01000724.1.p1  ORF type:complete len:1155 (+),score=530.18 GAFH01000724.1:461-3466(+)
MEHEQNIQLGRGWPYRLLGEEECHASGAIVRDIHVRPNRGDRVMLNFEIAEMLGRFGGGTQSTGGLGLVSAETILQFLALNGTTPRTVNVSGLLIPIAQALGITIPGSNVTTTVDPKVIATNLANSLNGALNITMEYSLVDSMEAPAGKYPSVLGNVVVVEMSFFEKELKKQLRQSVESAVATALSAVPFGSALAGPVVDQFLGPILSFINFEQMSIQVSGMLTNRYKLYTEDTTLRDPDFIRITNNIFEVLGDHYPVTLTLALNMAMSLINMIKLFLNQIFDSTTIILIILGSLLIFSLMLGNVEEKTYEYGMLRALGMNNKTLVHLLLTLSSWFSLPALGTGLLLVFIVMIPAIAAVGWVVLLRIPLFFDGNGAILCVLVGILMPLISNIFPIRRALSNTLRDSLDLYHQTFAETRVTFTHLERLGLSPVQTAVAIILVVVGFMMYYIAPSAFVYGNISLFLSIMNYLLIGLVIGLAIISTIFQPYLERLMLHLIMWGSDRPLKKLVRKSLAGHRSRNRKTALMFTISLAFIIFAGAMFALQASMISDNVQMGLGSDIVITAPSFDDPLAEDDMRAWLEAELALGKASRITGYTFTTFPLTSHRFVTATRLSNLAGWPETRVTVTGVESHFLYDTFNQFYFPGEVYGGLAYNHSSNGSPDVFQSLYDSPLQQRVRLEEEGIPTPVSVTSGLQTTSDDSLPLVRHSTLETYNNYYDVLISEGLRKRNSVDTLTPLRLEVTLSTTRGRTSETLNYLAKARGLLRKSPGFTFSSYGAVSSGSPVLLSIDRYTEILHEVINSTLADEPQDHFGNVPPKKTLFVACPKTATSFEVEAVVNALRNFIRDETTTVMDTRKLLQTTATAVMLINIFFIVVAVIAIILCFFVLWLSFTSNVRENSWEFGVLRSLGLTGWQTVRVYVYEGLALVFACIILGSLSGFLIAITLTLQFGVFTELPFKFSFPTELFLAAVALSIVTAIFGSILAARPMKAKDIAIVLRGGGN